MPINLELHRSEDSVWDRTGNQGTWDGERWLLAMLAGACLVTGVRRRNAAGLMMMIGGGALAWWASSGMDQRKVRRGRLRAVWPARVQDDPIREASEQSFPASDAPSWTPTTGNTTTANDSTTRPRNPGPRNPAH